MDYSPFVWESLHPPSMVFQKCQPRINKGDWEGLHRAFTTLLFHFISR